MESLGKDSVTAVFREMFVFIKQGAGHPEALLWRKETKAEWLFSFQ
jgi:hypothetical protein